MGTHGPERRRAKSVSGVARLPGRERLRGAAPLALPVVAGEDSGDPVPDPLEDVQLLRFEAGAPGGSFPVVSRFRGKVVGPDFYDKASIQPGSWWFCRVEDNGTYYLAHPIREFDVEDVLRARPELLPSLFPYLEQGGNGAGKAAPAPAVLAALPAPRGRTAGHSFVTLPRVETVRVSLEGLDLQGAADLLEGAACELLADKARGALAVRPAGEGSRHAWPLKDGAVRSPEPARLLGAGSATARWSDRWGVLVITKGIG